MSLKRRYLLSIQLELSKHFVFVIKHWLAINGTRFDGVNEPRQRVVN